MLNDFLFVYLINNIMKDRKTEKKELFLFKKTVYTSLVLILNYNFKLDVILKSKRQSNKSG